MRPHNTENAKPSAVLGIIIRFSVIEQKWHNL